MDVTPLKKLQVQYIPSQESQRHALQAPTLQSQPMLAPPKAASQTRLSTWLPHIKIGAICAGVAVVSVCAWTLWQDHHVPNLPAYIPPMAALSDSVGHQNAPPERRGNAQATNGEAPQVLIEGASGVLVSAPTANTSPLVAQPAPTIVESPTAGSVMSPQPQIAPAGQLVQAPASRPDVVDAAKQPAANPRPAPSGAAQESVTQTPRLAPRQASVAAVSRPQTRVFRTVMTAAKTKQSGNESAPIPAQASEQKIF